MERARAAACARARSGARGVEVARLPVGATKGRAQPPVRRQLAADHGLGHAGRRRLVGRSIQGLPCTRGGRGGRGRLAARRAGGRCRGGAARVRKAWHRVWHARGRVKRGAAPFVSSADPMQEA
eukprot:scaffold97123_cov40-Phaeocystis_antarctica.AAC.1